MMLMVMLLIMVLMIMIMLLMLMQMMMMIICVSHVSSRRPGHMSPLETHSKAQESNAGTMHTSEVRRRTGCAALCCVGLTPFTRR